MWRCVWADGIFFIDLFLLSAEYAIFVNMEYSEAINKIFEENTNESQFFGRLSFLFAFDLKKSFFKLIQAAGSLINHRNIDAVFREFFHDVIHRLVKLRIGIRPLP